MAERQDDPARLEGEQLRRWYLRSPDEIERERQASEAQRHADFFGASLGAAQEAQHTPPAASASDEGFLWVANGRGGYRAVRPGASDFLTTLEPGGAGDHPGHLPENSAKPEAGDFVEVGNPHNPRLRTEWELANNRPWPRTKDGRRYDVSHVRAIGDGGTNTLDNIEPMDPDDHKAKHKRDRDAERFGKRPGIARAFGGTVERPAHASRPRGGPTTVRGLGILGHLPNLLGFFNGRIRTDTPVHTWNDLLGLPSQDDLPREDLIA